MKSLKVLSVITALSFLFTLPVAAQKPSVDSLSAACAIVMDATTGEILYEKNADEKRSMASTTKIMTTLLALEQGDLEREIITTKEMVTVEGSGMGLLEGDTVTLEGLCYGMMLASGNDAANTVAIALAGSLPAFVDQMNAKAAKIGMNNTHFVTPSGLDADTHYSTAYDMAVLTRHALHNEKFCEIASSSSAVVYYGNPPYRRTITNHNKLLQSYEGCIGVKTGFTKKSGRCLVSAATREGATLICVTLSAPDDWKDHQTLLDYGFSQMETVTIPAETLSLPVVGGSADRIAVSCDAITLPVPSAAKAKLSVQLQAEPFLYAPVTAGEVIGVQAVLWDGALIASCPVIAGETAEFVPYRPGFWEKLLQNLCRMLTP